MTTVAAALAEKRAELEAQLASLSTQPEDQAGISFGKRIGEGTSIAVERLSEVAAHDGLQVLLGSVVRAQAKLAEGTLGVCDGCGDDIAPERLAALPWASLCIRCASRRESTGRRT